MIFDIIVIIFILFFTYAMMKKGGMKALLSLTGLLLSIFISMGVYPYISEGVYNTQIPENVEKTISLKLEEQYENASWESLDAMPDFIQHAVGAYADEKVHESSITIAQALTRIFINVLIFVLVVVITKILFALLAGCLNLSVKLPVIKQFNSLTGAACGFATSFAIVWILTSLLCVLAASNHGVEAFIQNSRTVMIMSNILPFKG